MGSFSIWHWLIVLAVVLILFGGGGKITRIMGDMAHGVKAFKKGLKEDEPSEEAKSIPSPGATIGAPGTATRVEPVLQKDGTTQG
jgi:sec-independent protein translocase protein TatA